MTPWCCVQSCNEPATNTKVLISDDGLNVVEKQFCDPHGEVVETLFGSKHKQESDRAAS